MPSKKTYIGKLGYVSLNLDKLHTLESELKKKYVTEVGVLSKKNTRKEGGDTNAQIGMKHEFGSVSEKLPPRSFLNMPLMLIMPRYMRMFGQRIIDSIDRNNYKDVYRNLGIKAQKIIDDAFATSGFGKWPKSRKVEQFRKDNPDAEKGEGPLTLVDTGQLRRSILSRVVEKK